MTNILNSISSNNQQNQIDWDNVKDAAWRHSIGRVSCAARIPIYAIGATVQLTKVVIKGAICPIVELAVWWTGTKDLDSWKFEAVKKDALFLFHLSDRIVNCFLSAIFAPPKQYRSFGTALENTFSIVFLGTYHENTQKNKITGISKEPLTVQQVFDMCVTARAEWKKTVFKAQNLCNDRFNSNPIFYSDERSINAAKAAKAG